jgi:hypothetical protein
MKQCVITDLNSDFQCYPTKRTSSSLGNGSRKVRDFSLSKLQRSFLSSTNNKKELGIVASSRRDSGFGSGFAELLKAS